MLAGERPGHAEGPCRPGHVEVEVPARHAATREAHDDRGAGVARHVVARERVADECAHTCWCGPGDVDVDAVTPNRRDRDHRRGTYPSAVEGQA
jgi:hypothetical protein